MLTRFFLHTYVRIVRMSDTERRAAIQAQRKAERAALVEAEVGSTTPQPTSLQDARG